MGVGPVPNRNALQLPEVVLSAENTSTAGVVEGIGLCAEALPCVTLLCSPEGACELANRPWSDYTGWPSQRARGAGWLQAFHSRDLESIQHAWTEAVSRGSVCEVEGRYRDRDGRYLWHQFRAVPVRGPRAELLHWVISAVNIHDRKFSAEQALREQFWLQSVLDLMPTPLLFIEPGSACVTFANQAADRIAGGDFPKWKPAQEYHTVYYCTDAEGQRIPDEQMPGVRVARGECIRNYYMDWHFPEGKRSLLVNAETLPPMHGHPATCVMVFQDVSRLKQTEAALRRSNEDLKQFTYAASHDLQEPLRMVSSYSDLIYRRLRDRLDSDGEQYLMFLTEGASRMKELLRSILEYAQSGDSAELHFAPVAAEQAFLKARENLRLAIEETGAEVTAGPLPSVEMAEAHLVQIFQNLIGNAIKYRREEPPRVMVNAMRTGVEYVFSVQDNGIGIHSRYFRRIFGMFKRLHGRKYPGTGIGLAICGKLVEQYGGRIWLESEIGKGSTFYFSIPVQRSSSDD